MKIELHKTMYKNHDNFIHNGRGGRPSYIAAKGFKDPVINEERCLYMFFQDEDFKNGSRWVVSDEPPAIKPHNRYIHVEDECMNPCDINLSWNYWKNSAANDEGWSNKNKIEDTTRGWGGKSQDMCQSGCNRVKLNIKNIDNVNTHSPKKNIDNDDDDSDGDNDDNDNNVNDYKPNILKLLNNQPPIIHFNNYYTYQNNQKYNTPQNDNNDNQKCNTPQNDNDDNIFNVLNGDQFPNQIMMKLDDSELERVGWN